MPCVLRRRSFGRLRMTILRQLLRPNKHQSKVINQLLHHGVTLRRQELRRLQERDAVRFPVGQGMTPSGRRSFATLRMTIGNKPIGNVNVVFKVFGRCVLLQVVADKTPVFVNNMIISE